MSEAQVKEKGKSAIAEATARVPIKTPAKKLEQRILEKKAEITDLKAEVERLQNEQQLLQNYVNEVVTRHSIAIIELRVLKGFQEEENEAKKESSPPPDAVKT